MKHFLETLLSLAILFSVGCTNSSKIIENNLGDHSKKNSLKPSPIGKEIVEVEVDFVSPSYNANGKKTIRYELSVVNNFRQNLLLNAIEIIDANSEKTVLTSFDTDYVKNNFILFGKRNAAENNILEPGRKGVISLTIAWNSSDTIPDQIFHCIRLGVPSKDSLVEIPFDVALLNLQTTTSIKLGLPFRKGTWFYTAESHKNSRFITQGNPTYPQRFAIDWAYIKDNGVFVDGDKHKNESYPTYGKEMLAVADGIVVEIKNEIPDNIPEQIDVKITRETISGNYLVLDIGNDVYAVYAHLIPSSFKMKVGEKVKKGDVLGLLGNSGNSDGPHLHFHLETKSPRILGGEGIPYHFEKFRQLKTYSSEELGTIFNGESLDLNDVNSEIRRNELPVGHGVIRFE